MKDGWLYLIDKLIDVNVGVMAAGIFSSLMGRAGQNAAILGIAGIVYLCLLRELMMEDENEDN